MEPEPEKEEANEIISKQDFSAWESAYSKLIAETQAYINWLLVTDKWLLVYNNSQEDQIRFRLFEMHLHKVEFPCKPSLTYHAVKVSGVLHARADRVMYVIKDQDPDTRLKWDSEDMVSVQELNTFKTAGGDIKVMLSEVRSPFPLFDNVTSMGIQWCGYTNKTRTHKLIFRNTTNHYYHRLPENATVLDGMSGVVVRALAQTPEDPHPRCEVIIVAYIGLGKLNVFSGILKERLRQRLGLYERVAKKWDHYYGKDRDPKLLKNRK